MLECTACLQFSAKINSAQCKAYSMQVQVQVGNCRVSHIYCWCTVPCARCSSQVSRPHLHLQSITEPRAFNKQPIHVAMHMLLPFNIHMLQFHNSQRRDRHKASKKVNRIGRGVPKKCKDSTADLLPIAANQTLICTSCTPPLLSWCICTLCHLLDHSILPRRLCTG